MSVLEWSEPPAVGTRYRKWGPVVDELKSRPGEWGLIARDVTEAECESARTYFYRLGCRTRRRTINGKVSFWAMHPGDPA